MAQGNPARTQDTVDQGDVARFAALAESWWDPDGPFRPLHALNPVRLGYIRRMFDDRFGLDPKSLKPFKGLRLLDLGCGGGLLTEPLARLGADMVGADAAAEGIEVARAHAAQAGLDIDYRVALAEDLAAAGERFDAVVAMEVVEHVADLGLFLKALGQLVRPGGAVALATLNRTWKSYAMAIVGAEYVLRWLPPGTHDWDKFVRPSELARGLRAGGLDLADVTGVGYDALRGDWSETRDAGVNYLAFATKP